MRAIGSARILTTVRRTYVVECYWPEDGEAALIAGAARATAAARDVRTAGRFVVFLGSVLIPGDEVCFWLFRGESLAGVEETGARTGLVVNRVVECIELIAERDIE
jgi:hypothetical protein